MKTQAEVAGDLLLGPVCGSSCVCPALAAGPLTAEGLFHLISPLCPRDRPALSVTAGCPVGCVLCWPPLLRSPALNHSGRGAGRGEGRGPLFLLLPPLPGAPGMPAFLTRKSTTGSEIDHSRLALSSGHNVTSSKRWSQKRCHITLFIFFPQQLS